MKRAAEAPEIDPVRSLYHVPGDATTLQDDRDPTSRSHTKVNAISHRLAKPLQCRRRGIRSGIRDSVFESRRHGGIARQWIIDAESGGHLE